jgi:hypothetical protein
MQYESWSPLPCSQRNTNGWVSPGIQYPFTDRNNYFSIGLEDVFECLTAILTQFSSKGTAFSSCDLLLLWKIHHQTSSHLFLCLPGSRLSIGW